MEEDSRSLYSFLRTLSPLRFLHYKNGVPLVAVCNKGNLWDLVNEKILVENFRLLGRVDKETAAIMFSWFASLKGKENAVEKALEMLGNLKAVFLSFVWEEKSIILLETGDDRRKKFEWQEEEMLEEIKSLFPISAERESFLPLFGETFFSEYGIFIQQTGNVFWVIDPWEDKLAAVTNYLSLNVDGARLENSAPGYILLPEGSLFREVFLSIHKSPLTKSDEIDSFIRT